MLLAMDDDEMTIAASLSRAHLASCSFFGSGLLARVDGLHGVVSRLKLLLTLVEQYPAARRVGEGLAAEGLAAGRTAAPTSRDH